jgi:Homeodomain
VRNEANMHRNMQFVPSYPAQYMHAAPMVVYPNEVPMAYNHQFACEDILAAGQRDVESRGRRRITRQQSTILENAFNENTKPNRNVRQELAHVLAISPRNVQVWSLLAFAYSDLVPEQTSKGEVVEENRRAAHA